MPLPLLLQIILIVGGLVMVLVGLVVATWFQHRISARLGDYLALLLLPGSSQWSEADHARSVTSLEREFRLLKSWLYSGVGILYAGGIWLLLWLVL